MKFALAVLALLAVTAAALPALTHEEATFVFSRWMKEHNKHYATSAEFDGRLSTFKTNVELVRNHQANPKRSWEMGLTKFADLTFEEFAEFYFGYVFRQRDYLRSKNLAPKSAKNIVAPASVDWVAQGKVTPIKDQGQCGSCWAFSTTGSVESAYAIENNAAPISLSEQELVDCAQSTGNQGCEGGLMDDAFEWIINSGGTPNGLCTESDYPYTAQDGTCAQSNCTAAMYITGFTDVTANSESALATAVVQQPISIAVDASQGWQLYTGGILTPACGCSTNLDHGVLLVGYGTSSGTAYWKVKNSWGTSWGEDGYIRLQRNTGGSGTCGLCMDPSYPTGASTSPSKRHH
jgi:cathepsin L